MKAMYLAGVGNKGSAPSSSGNGGSVPGSGGEWRGIVPASVGEWRQCTCLRLGMEAIYLPVEGSGGSVSGRGFNKVMPLTWLVYCRTHGK
jgi:hypothetical protein